MGGNAANIGRSKGYTERKKGGGGGRREERKGKEGRRGGKGDCYLHLRIHLCLRSVLLGFMLSFHHGSFCGRILISTAFTEFLNSTT